MLEFGYYNMDCMEGMKEICKNCESCRPSYKGGVCERNGKKVKLSGSCEYWNPKQRGA